MGVGIAEATGTLTGREGIGKRALRLWSTPTGLGITSIVVLLVVWQLVGMATTPLFLPTPINVAGAIPTVLRAGLISAYLTSMLLFAGAFAVAVLIGVSLGVLFGLNRTCRYLSAPIVTGLYTTPFIIIIPLLVLWFGLSWWTIFVVVAVSSLFPTLISTQAGVAEVGPSMKELGLAFGANRREMLSKIILPAIVPYIITGIRIAAPHAFVSLVGAQMLITVQGIGGIAFTYGQRYETDAYFVPVIMVILTSMALMQGLRRLERRVTPWSQTLGER